MSSCAVRTGAVACIPQAQASRPAYPAARCQIARRTPSLAKSQAGARARGSVAAKVAVKEAETNNALKDGKDEDEEAEEESAFQASEEGPDPPTPFELETLLMEICDETSIAELKLKVGSFSLHMKRDFQTKAAPAPAAFFAPPVPSFPMAETMAASPAPAPPAPAASGPAVDEGLLSVNSPTVGILRLGRIFKGKRGRNLVDAGSPVKKGQVVCYIEQLGTQLTVESEHAGEVVDFLFDDGDAVGFGDALISIRPSFPGIKELA